MNTAGVMDQSMQGSFIRISNEETSLEFLTIVMPF